MRVVITGKSGSGKSTALHRLIQTALQASWSHILLADGKSVELHRYAGASLRVFGEREAEAFAAALTAAADRLTDRYQALRARGLQQAPPDDPRELLVVDEVQEFTRHPKHGKAIRDALVRIFEKSGALDDLVIVASQRATAAVPPSARVNANVQLRLLGAGYYQLVADGQANRQGRVDPAAPLAPPSSLAPAELLRALGAPPAARPPTLIVRYEGASGSGRTYALAHHPAPEGARRVVLDCRTHSHKSLLADCLEKCGATAPPDANIATLAEAAALALQATPTLLLLDNCEYASAKTLGSLQQLLDAAAQAAIAMTPPRSDDHTRDPLAPLRRRAARVELQPLSRETASALIRQIAPTIDPASEQTIIQRSAGHAQTVAAYAERVEAHGDDERHALESYRSPRRWLVVLIMLVAFIAIIYAQRHLVENDLIAAIGTGIIAVTLWLLRPRFMKLTRPK